LVLGRVRDALGARTPDAATEYAGISRDYHCAPSLDPVARIVLFADRLRHYDVGVAECGADAIAATIGAVLAARGKRRLLIPADLPREWLPSSVEVVPDVGLTYADLDVSEGVVTGCSLAIASTGTIVLRHDTGEGRRALTLVPDYHLSVVFADQVVETVPEGIRRIAAIGGRLVTTISGPSATADIEMTRIRGVHGPRTLDVVIVGTPTSSSGTPAGLP
jgi:L-lactate dehydrogenase complex protein LldG